MATAKTKDSTRPASTSTAQAESHSGWLIPETTLKQALLQAARQAHAACLPELPISREAKALRPNLENWAKSRGVVLVPSTPSAPARDFGAWFDRRTVVLWQSLEQAFQELESQTLVSVRAPSPRPVASGRVSQPGIDPPSLKEDREVGSGGDPDAHLDPDSSAKHDSDFDQNFDVDFDKDVDADVDQDFDQDFDQDYGRPPPIACQLGFPECLNPGLLPADPSAAPWPELTSVLPGILARTYSDVPGVRLHDPRRVVRQQLRRLKLLSALIQHWENAHRSERAWQRLVAWLQRQDAAQQRAHDRVWSDWHTRAAPWLPFWERMAAQGSFPTPWALVALGLADAAQIAAEQREIAQMLQRLLARLLALGWSGPTLKKLASIAFSLHLHAYLIEALLAAQRPCRFCHRPALGKLQDCTDHQHTDPGSSKTPLQRWSRLNQAKDPIWTLLAGHTAPRRLRDPRVKAGAADLEHVQRWLQQTAQAALGQALKGIRRTPAHGPSTLTDAWQSLVRDWLANQQTQLREQLHPALEGLISNKDLLKLDGPLPWPAELIQEAPLRLQLAHHALTCLDRYAQEHAAVEHRWLLPTAPMDLADVLHVQLQRWLIHLLLDLLTPSLGAGLQQRLLAQLDALCAALLDGTLTPLLHPQKLCFSNWLLLVLNGYAHRSTQRAWGSVLDHPHHPHQTQAPDVKPGSPADPLKSLQKWMRTQEPGLWFGADPDPSIPSRWPLRLGLLRTRWEELAADTPQGAPAPWPLLRDWDTLRETLQRMSALHAYHALRFWEDFLPLALWIGTFKQRKKQGCPAEQERLAVRLAWRVDTFHARALAEIHGGSAWRLFGPERDDSGLITQARGFDSSAHACIARLWHALIKPILPVTPASEPLGPDRVAEPSGTKPSGTKPVLRRQAAQLRRELNEVYAPPDARVWGRRIGSHASPYTWHRGALDIQDRPPNVELNRG